MRILVNLMIGAVTLVALLLGGVWLLQARLIFFPQPLGATHHLPAGTQEIDLTAGDGVRLHGWLRPAARTPAPLVLYFGGNAEEVSWTLADGRWPRAWSVAALNYRGYGRSGGHASEAALVADALAIHDALTSRPDVLAPIVVFGRSLGTGIAVQVAAVRRVAGAILASPYDSLVEVGRGHYPWLPVAWLLRHRFDARRPATQVEAPLLALVAAQDAIVPAGRSRALYDAWRGPKTWRVVPETDHDTLALPDTFWREVADFLEARGR